MFHCEYHDQSSPAFSDKILMSKTRSCEINVSFNTVLSKVTVYLLYVTVCIRTKVAHSVGDYPSF